MERKEEALLNAHVCNFATFVDSVRTRTEVSFCFVYFEGGMQSNLHHDILYILGSYK